MPRTFFDLPQTRFASVLSTGLGAHGLAESSGIPNKSLRMLKISNGVSFTFSLSKF